MERLYLEFPSAKDDLAALTNKRKMWDYAIPTLLLTATFAYTAL
jgi:hypothetical protein